jgi:hypothetical protein
MTPTEFATSYDQVADRWNNDNFPHDNGIEQHKRAVVSEAGCICRHLEYGQYPGLHLYVIVQRA